MIKAAIIYTWTHVTHVKVSSWLTHALTHCKFIIKWLLVYILVHHYSCTVIHIFGWKRSRYIKKVTNQSFFRGYDDITKSPIIIWPHFGALGTIWLPGIGTTDMSPWKNPCVTITWSPYIGPNVKFCLWMCTDVTLKTANQFISSY